MKVRLTLLRIAMAAGICGAISACSMANSVNLPPGQLAGCQSDHGAYHLPVHYLRVQITGDRRTSAPTFNIRGDFQDNTLDKVKYPKLESFSVSVAGGPVAKPDRTRGFCLDFLGSIISNDLLKVQRENGLLKLVTTTQKLYDTEGWTLLAKGDELRALQSSDASVSIANKIETAAQGIAKGLGTTGGTTTSLPTPNFAKKNVGVPTSNKFKPGFSDRINRDGKTDDEIAEQKKFACEDITDSRVGNRVKFQNKVISNDKDTDPFVEFCDENQPNEGAVRKNVHPDEPSDVRAQVERNSTTGEDVVYSSEFNPTDPVEAAITNHGLREYGYCVILNDGQVQQRDRDAYCENPLAFAKHKGWEISPSRKAKFEGYINYTKGILYRPLQTFTLYILKKRNRRVRGGWALLEQRPIRIANLSPMISVGVNRTMFSSRNTRITFNEGVLQSIAIDKKSELLGAVEIPLGLVRSLAVLPTAVIQLRFNSSSKMVELLELQAQLLDADKKYSDALNNYAQITGAPSFTTTSQSTIASSGDPGLDQCLRSCLEAGSDQISCQNLCP